MKNSIAIQVRGYSHEATALPCQDVCSVESTPHKAWLALADGAGFSSLAQEGAKATVQHVKGLLWRIRKAGEKGLTETEKDAFLTDIQFRLEVLAKEKSCEVGLLASTLLAVQVWNGYYIAFHLGDGVIGCYHSDDSVSELSAPENGRYANQTWFTTSMDAKEHLRFYHGKLGNIQGFFAMSDGAANSLYDSQRHLFAPLVAEIFKKMHAEGVEPTSSSLKKLMEGVIREQTKDDISFACFLCPSTHDVAFQKWKNKLGVDNSEEATRRYLTMIKIMCFVLARKTMYCSYRNMQRHAHWQDKDFYHVILRPLIDAQLLIHEGSQLYRAGENANKFVKECHDNA